METTLSIIIVSGNLITFVSIIYLITHVYNNAKVQSAAPIVNNVALRLALAITASGCLMDCYDPHTTLSHAASIVGLTMLMILIVWYHKVRIVQLYDIRL